MALSVATNTGALMAQAAASSVNKEMEISMERLSTGKRINGASDDAAGVAIASRLTSEIRGTNQAIRNAMDGQAMLDTAEGAHVEIESILQRMRELSVQSANDTNNANDRANLQIELDNLVDEIDRIAATTSWAGEKLLNATGGASGTFKFHVGSRGAADDAISTSIASMTAASLGVAEGTAAIRANAASLETVGANVLQFSNTAVEGDKFAFTMNGDDFEVTVGAIATSGNMAFTWTSVDGSGGSGTVTASEGGATAKGLAHAVADAITDEVTNTGTHLGITATGADDGSVTILQGDSVTVSTVSGGHATGGGILTDGSIKILAADITEIASSGTYAFTVNGESIDINVGTDVYSDDKAGVAAALNAAIASETKLQGMNIVASVSTNDVVIAISGSVTLADVSATPTSSTSSVAITSQSAADAAIDTIDAAILSVNNQRASLGSVSNRLDSTVSNLTNISANLQAGRGRIEDADFAAETTNLAKTQILQQASTAMLAQANASKQNVLSLLQG